MRKAKIGMTGQSKTPPKSGARPSGSSKPTGKKNKTMSEKLAELPDAEPEVRSMLDAAISGTEPEKISDDPQKVVDTATAIEVSSNSSSVGNEATTETISEKDKKMTLNLSGLNKKGNAAIYKGAAGSVRISVAAFHGKTPPTTIEVADGVFEPARQPKAKMTAEERKALRASQPKPTLAERIAKREEALARDKAKLAAQAQPSL